MTEILHEGALEAAREAYRSTYDAEYLLNGTTRDNSDAALEAAIEAYELHKPDRVRANPCIQKLKEDEPFFVLLGRDKHAALATRAWADAREAERGVSTKTTEARQIAQAMDEYAGTPSPTPQEGVSGQEPVAKARQIVEAYKELPMSMSEHEQLSFLRADIAKAFSGDPTAWRVNVDGDWVYADNRAYAEKMRTNGNIIEPLYAHPAPLASHAALVEALEAYEAAIDEAEAIFGGEYADHYGPMFELAMKARDKRRAALSASPLPASYEKCSRCDGHGHITADSGDDIRPCPECKGNTVTPTLSQGDEDRIWNEAVEECATKVEPKGEIPCGCEHCYCGKPEDAQRDAVWRAEKQLADSIRSLKRPTASGSSSPTPGENALSPLVEAAFREGFREGFSNAADQDHPYMPAPQSEDNCWLGSRALASLNKESAK